MNLVTLYSQKGGQKRDTEKDLSYITIDTFREFYFLEEHIREMKIRIWIYEIFQSNK